MKNIGLWHDARRRCDFLPDCYNDKELVHYMAAACIAHLSDLPLKQDPEKTRKPQGFRRILTAYSSRSLETSLRELSGR